ncbi:hypothetical protein A0H81_12092 [Grifola frondosa]|uniref:Nephrocystin 3-like N-terminal domain-containing protein n=1 Tax=Grifola frondosa TaxID=5627 RepID=A0A1C7LRV6_GRIFR|nr:hypothetical protein A0H81_12092 [Grifola frondosa]
MRHKNPTPRPRLRIVVLPATPVPGLGTAAAALISLIDKIMIVKQNEYIRRDVAQSINALAISIDQAGSQINGRFGDAVECDMPKIKATLESSSLNSQVQTLLTTLRELTIEADQLSPDNQSFGWRFIRGDGNAKILTRIKDRLADARSRFIIQAQVVIGGLVNGVDNRNDHDLNKKQLYILSGASGTGKSTIAYEVAKRLEAQGLLGASFFFARAGSSAADYLSIRRARC